MIIHFHGGGWSLGALDQSDWLCSEVCIGVGAVVVSVDYRLAPTYRFPTAVLDSIAAVHWVAENAAELGVDAGRIGVMGDSAGGNLATVITQIMRDRGGPKISHQALMYPATDLRTPEEFDPSSTARADWPILSSASMVTFRDHYLGPDGDATDPMASPILADDLSGLPPALIQVAEYDPLRDDGIRYARALQAAGTPARLTEYVGMPHGYFSFPKVIRGSIMQALAELCAEQRYALHGVPALDRTVPQPPAGRGALPVAAAHTRSRGAVARLPVSRCRSRSTPPRPASSSGRAVGGCDRSYCRYFSTVSTLRADASSAFWPNSRFARRCRNRSQHWSRAPSSWASRSCSSCEVSEPSCTLVRSWCSWSTSVLIWVRI